MANINLILIYTIWEIYMNNVKLRRMWNTWFDIFVYFFALEILKLLISNYNPRIFKLYLKKNLFSICARTFRRACLRTYVCVYVRTCKVRARVCVDMCVWTGIIFEQVRFYCFPVEKGSIAGIAEIYRKENGIKTTVFIVNVKFFASFHNISVLILLCYFIYIQH